jgi:hypothetical protein
MGAAPHPFEGTSSLLKKHGNFSSWPFKAFRPIIFVFIFAFLAVVFLVVSPYIMVLSLASNRRTSRFEKRMKELGRTIELKELRKALHEQSGTLISEHGSEHRLWWTPEDAIKKSLLPLPQSFEQAESAGFQVGTQWLFERYTSPVTGKAMLVTDRRKNNKDCFWWREFPTRLEIICPTDVYYK